VIRLNECGDKAFNNKQRLDYKTETGGTNGIKVLLLRPK